jgi:hypothetical protein
MSSSSSSTYLLIKMPRRKKRISVMSTESVDVKVMSAFLQEALDEVDSDGDDWHEYSNNNDGGGS